jgi:hypothetical protein
VLRTHGSGAPSVNRTVGDVATIIAELARRLCYASPSTLNG